jgi:hypothetical protein
MTITTTGNPLAAATATLRVAGAAIIAVGLSGCGDDDDGGAIDAALSADDGGEGDAATGADASTGDAARSDAARSDGGDDLPDAAVPDGDGGAAPPLLASVLVGEGEQFGMTYGFVRAVVGTEPLFQPVIPLGGGCAIVSETEGGHSAGTIGIAGAKVPIAMTPSGAPFYSYEPPEVPGDIVDPGDLLTISATGAEVPAFSGMVTVPAPVAGFTPPAEVSRTADLPLEWEAAGANGMLIILIALGRGDATQIFCSTDDDGSFTVPAAALGEVPADAIEGILLLMRRNVNLFPAPGPGPGDADAAVELWGVMISATGPLTLSP